MRVVQMVENMKPFGVVVSVVKSRWVVEVEGGSIKKSSTKLADTVRKSSKQKEISLPRP